MTPAAINLLILEAITGSYIISRLCLFLGSSYIPLSKLTILGSLRIAWISGSAIAWAALYSYSSLLSPPAP
jgi:hypothetical protein